MVEKKEAKSLKTDKNFILAVQPFSMSARLTIKETKNDIMKTQAIFIAAAMILTSCSTGVSVFSKKIEPSPNDTTIEKSVAAFNRITSNTVCEIIYTQTNDNKYTVTISGPENFVALQKVNVDNGTLSLSQEKEANLNLNKRRLTITIAAPAINTFKNNGVGSVSINNLKTGNFTLDSNGVGETTIHNTNVTTLHIENNGVGSIDCTATTAHNLTADNSGVGSISISGTAEKATYENSGVGSIEAAGLKAKTVYARNSGVGAIEAYASESGEYTNRGIGSVNMTGGGKITKIK